MKPLTERRDEYVEIGNDDDARCLLSEYGLLDKFSKRPAFASEWCESMHFADHPTHWIIALHYTGFINPADNGYFLRCFPKSRFSLAQMQGVVAQAAADLYPDGVKEYRSSPTQRDTN